MKFSFSRRIAVALAAVAVLAVIVLPVVALADTPGTTIDNPKSLSTTFPWAAPETTTLVSYEWKPGSTDYEYFYEIYLTRGQTLSLDASTTAVGSRFDVLILPSFAFDMTAWADWTGDNTRHLTFMAPRSAYYLINPMCDTPIDYSMMISPIAAPKYTLSSVALSTSKPKKNKAFTVAVRTYGEYDSFLSPITFAVQRLSGKKYKAYKSYKGSYAGGDTTYTKFNNTVVKLPAGKYQVQAVFADAAHSKKVTKFKTFTVK